MEFTHVCLTRLWLLVWPMDMKAQHRTRRKLQATILAYTVARNKNLPRKPEIKLRKQATCRNHPFLRLVRAWRWASLAHCDVDRLHLEVAGCHSGLEVVGGRRVETVALRRGPRGRKIASLDGQTTPMLHTR